MADKYETNERVFAKMKGYPPWPARVIERMAGKEEKYRIVFYGTHDEGTVKLDQMFKYNDTTKAKYGKNPRQAQLKKAMEEIEADVLNNTEENSTTLEAEKNKEDSEGELTIDEGLGLLPPTLTREINKTETNETGGNKGKRPRTLSKRDSVSSTSGTHTPVLAPSTPDISQPPSTTEIVSRSGRKIKPKRFADDEISTPTSIGTKATSKAAANGSEDSGPPSKKAKRTSKSVGGKNATQIPVSPLPEERDEQPIKARVVTGKGKNVTNQPPSKQISRLSPDISSPMNSRGPPTLKAAPVKRSGSSANKQLPALIPTASLSKANLRKSERHTRSKSMEDPEEEAMPLVPESNKNDIDKENSESKESFDETQEENESTNKSSTIINKKEDPIPMEEEKIPDPLEKKVRVNGKNGLQFELSYQLKKDPESENEEDPQTWQAIAEENVEKLKEELSKSDVESQDIINSTAEVIEHLDVVELKSRERRSSQIRLLRLEGEVIEIIGEIVGCLSVSSADCLRAIELLERLEGHQLNVLMLKKHPEVVDTIKRLRCYIGNVTAWNYTQKEKEEFEELALAVRQKAVVVYKHFQELFCTNPDDIFIKIFREEVNKFKASVEGLPLKTILGLTEEEETGELQEFEMDMNGDTDGVEAEPEKVQ